MDALSETRVPPSVYVAHPLEVVAFSRVVVQELGRFGYLTLAAGTTRKPPPGKRLVRMGVCRGDSCHKPDSPVHAIAEVPWIIQITAVMVVGVEEKSITPITTFPYWRLLGRIKVMRS